MHGERIRDGCAYLFWETDKKRYLGTSAGRLQRRLTFGFGIKKGKGMKQYKVFEYPTGKLEAVKQGWSWPGFFFNMMWAFWKNIWALGGILFAVYFTLGCFGVVSEGNTETVIKVIIFFAYLIFSILLGGIGNFRREKNLQGRGYTFRATTIAANPEGATALYIKKNQTQ
jgi:hypothetical protein